MGRPLKGSLSRRGAVALTVFWMVAVGMVLAVAYVEIRQDGQRASAPPPAEPDLSPEALMHDGQRSFCTILERFHDRFSAAKAEAANELLLAKIRRERGDLTRQTNATSGRMSNWIGTVSHISTAADAFASVSIDLPCKIPATVRTAAAVLSDREPGTLIHESSRVYQQLVHLKQGQLVRFSGRFLADPIDGYQEGSITELGSMTRPEYLMRFALFSTQLKPSAEENKLADEAKLLVRSLLERACAGDTSGFFFLVDQESMRKALLERGLLGAVEKHHLDRAAVGKLRREAEPGMQMAIDDALHALKRDIAKGSQADLCGAEIRSVVRVAGGVRFGIKLRTKDVELGWLIGRRAGRTSLLDMDTDQ
jgi:hypothetical protein